LEVVVDHPQKLLLLKLLVDLVEEEVMVQVLEEMELLDHQDKDTLVEVDLVLFHLWVLVVEVVRLLLEQMEHQMLVDLVEMDI